MSKTPLVITSKNLSIWKEFGSLPFRPIILEIDSVFHSRPTQRLYIYLNSCQQFASELVLVWRLPVQRPLVSALQMDFSSVEIWIYFCSFSSHQGTGRRRSDIGQFVSILLLFTVPITLGRYSPPLTFPCCIPLALRWHLSSSPPLVSFSQPVKSGE